MKKLILATESFPYGKSEFTFILPELERLRKRYEVIILSHADPKQQRAGVFCAVPEDVRVLCLGRPQLSVLDKLKAILLFLTDRDGQMEIREILENRSARRERLYQSLSFYAQALADQKKLRQSGVLSADEKMIYYSFWYSYFCYSMVRELRRYPNIHMVTRTHGIDLYHERIPGGRQPLRHVMERGLDSILFACAYGASYYESHVKAERTKRSLLQVCRLGIEQPGRRMPLSEKEEKELLSCSNVIPLKRIRLIIDGLARIEDVKIHWTHIGDGIQLEQLRDYARQKLENKSNIRYTFAGFVEDVRAYYDRHQVDCFITTSETEGGCPVSIQEAMSYGVPVIGTSVGGITEMIADNGILLSKDPAAAEVAEAVRKIVSQEEQELLKMKEASYQKWAAEFDADKSFERLDDILKKL